jgi:hypothetical protein
VERDADMEGKLKPGVQPSLHLVTVERTEHRVSARSGQRAPATSRWCAESAA